MKAQALVSTVAILVLLGCRPTVAQSQQELETIRRQIEALAAGQAALQKQLDELLTMVRGRQPQAPPANPVVDTTGAPAKGAATARVTIVEFSDYQCPYCGRYTRDTFDQLDKEYISPGKVRYVFRNLPLESIHAQAFKAHEAALCAGEQGKYWEMHHQLFTNQTALQPDALVTHAKAAGADVTKFQQCLASGKFGDRIREDINDAARAGAQGTPTFFIGLTAPGDTKIKTLRIIRGAHPFSSFKEALDALLASQ
jgi:protein-disulfide isomerase